MQEPRGSRMKYERKRMMMKEVCAKKKYNEISKKKKN